VFGDTTSFFKPMICMFLRRHLGSSSICVSSDALDDGLERPDEMLDAGDVERGEVEYTLRRLKRR